MNRHSKYKKSALTFAQRSSILECLIKNNHDVAACSKELEYSPQQIRRVVAWDKHRTLTPNKKKVMAELSLRERLYGKMVQTIEEANRPAQELIASFIASDLMPTVPDDATPQQREQIFNDARELLGIYMNALGKQADRAIKVLYGLPDALKAQGETKHTGTVEIEARMAVIVANLAEGRKRVAQLGSGTSPS